MDILSLDNSDNFALLTLRREEGFNTELIQALTQTLDELLQNPDCQGLILTGQGKLFSPGFDLNFLSKASQDEAMAFLDSSMKMVGKLLRYPLPVIAAINGHAFGLGAMIALASDYRVMREDRGYFCMPEIDLGMTLTERMNALLCAKLSPQNLRDVLLCGLRIPAPEALQRGIIDRSASEAELLETAKAVAAPMLGKDRNALAGLKRGINRTVLQRIEGGEVDVVMPAG